MTPTKPRLTYCSICKDGFDLSGTTKGNHNLNGQIKCEPYVCSKCEMNKILIKQQKQNELTIIAKN